MAEIRTTRYISDISGDTTENLNEVGKLIIRSAPGLEPGRSKALDVLAKDIDRLVGDAGKLVIFEVRPPGNEPSYVVMTTVTQFNSRLPRGVKLEQLLNKVPFLRGRRRAGSSPIPATSTTRTRRKAANN